MLEFLTGLILGMIIGFFINKDATLEIKYNWDDKEEE